MADKSINLLQSEELSAAQKKRIFILRMGTAFLVVFYCLLIVAIFSFWLVVQRESQVISDKTKLEKTRLNELEKTESLQFLLKQRLSSLSKVVETDKPKPKYWLNYLDSLVPEGIALEDIKWDSEGKIELSGSASNGLVLSEFIESLKQATDKQKIASSTLVSATRQKEGAYSFSFEIQVK